MKLSEISIKKTTSAAVLINNGEQFLIVHPTNYSDQEWDLPKGNIDQGETAAQAAIREVKEETGLTLNPHILKYVGSFPYKPTKDIVLFTYYTDIYNKVRKDEIDLKILFRAFEVLQDIEDGKLDQHEGSFLVGALLKELYVDSAIRKAEKLDEQNKEEKIEPKKPEVQISWKQFKAASQK
mgnify:CR=1 FL=1